MLMLRSEFLIMSTSESVYDANHDDELNLTRIKLFLTQNLTQTLAIRLSDHEMCDFTNHVRLLSRSRTYTRLLLY